MMIEMSQSKYNDCCYHASNDWYQNFDVCTRKVEWHMKHYFTCMSVCKHLTWLQWCMYVACKSVFNMRVTRLPIWHITFMNHTCIQLETRGSVPRQLEEEGQNVPHDGPSAAQCDMICKHSTMAFFVTYFASKKSGMRIMMSRAEEHYEGLSSRGTSWGAWWSRGSSCAPRWAQRGSRRWRRAPARWRG